MRREVVYEVRASTGSYEDARDWSVAAYPNRGDAQTHMEAAAREEERIRAWACEGDNWEFIGEPDDPRNPYDPEGGDRGCAHYYVVEIAVSRKFRRHRSPRLPSHPVSSTPGDDQ